MGATSRRTIIHRRATPPAAACWSVAIRVCAPFLILGSSLAAPRSFAGNQIWTGTAPRAKSIEAIARDPLNPSRLWAATFGAGVYRSLDGGVTWAGYREGLVNTFVRCLAVEPLHPDSIYCGTNDGVFISVDGGVTWKKQLSTNHSVRSLTIHPVLTGVLYAGTYGNGIYKTLNAGKNWSPINLGLANVNIRDVALHPSKPETLLAASGTAGGIHRSINGGLTWAQVADTTASLGACEQIQFDLQDPLRVYAAELDRGVIRSTDGGTTWFRINRGLTNSRARSLAVVDTLRYVGTDGSGVFFTTLSDTMWHPASTGLTSLTVDALLAFASAPGTCWAGTDGGGICRTDDRGASWAPLDGGILNTLSFSLAVRPSSHAVYDGSGFGDQFWRSTDGGGTWARATSLVSHDSEHGVAPDPLLPQTLYLSAYGTGVYRSDDDGVTWSNPDSLNNTLVNKFVRDLVAKPGESGHLYVGTGNGVWESVDGGAHWDPRNGGGLPVNFSVRSLALIPGAPPPTPDTLYAGSDSGGVWRSSDGGANWAAKNVGLPTPFIHSLLADLAVPGTVYAGSDSGVFKSTDGGDNWAAARSGLPYGLLGSVRVLVQDAVHPALLFCGVYGSGVFQSADGGAHWTPVFNQLGLSDPHVRAVAVDGAAMTLYAGTEDGVSALSNYSLSPPTGVDDDQAVAGLSLSAWPNPARAGTMTIRFTLARPGPLELAVFDLAGARQRTLVQRSDAAAGAQTVGWNMHDDRGHVVAPGLYFLRLQSDAGARIVRVAVLSR